ncbi:hypothetical protein Q2T40_04930 [Winogradskyella maritima]|nr:hypothetical protein [Winogradskyella maritima]
MTYYDSSTRNQIINIIPILPADIPVNLLTPERFVIMVLRHRQFCPVVNDNFKWNAIFNFATNQSEVKDLGGVDFTLTSANGAYIQAREGGSISAIYGRGFQRVEDETSPFFGQKIINNQGIPVRTDDLVYQGDYAPDFTLGFKTVLNTRMLT